MQRLRQTDFWKKALSGRVWASAIGELFGALRVTVGSSLAGPAPLQGSAFTLEQRMAEGLASFDGHTLLVLSGNDYTAKEFLETVQLDPVWRSQLARLSLTRVDVAAADHTFSQPEAQERVEQVTAGWLGRMDSRA